MMRELRQIAAVTLLSLRSIPQRLGSSLVIVVGMAAVVAVVITVLSMSSGFLQSVNKTGRADRAIVTSSGAVTESLSSLSHDAIRVIIDTPGVKRSIDGKALVSADIFAYQPVTKRSDGLFIPATLHGVGPEVFALLPQITLVSGRMFKPGLHEMIVGRMMQSQLEGMQVGRTIPLPEGDWSIVGSFESDADQHESELLGDAETLMAAVRRTSFNSATVMLDSPEAFDTFKKALTTNPAVSVDVTREDVYFAILSKPLNDFLTLVAYAVGGIMGLGAIFGALNTMYSAVSVRTVEIATLRAIGFGAGAIVISIFAEALLLTSIGAALGAGLAWLLFSGIVVVSDYYIYTLVVKPALITLGVLWALATGILGGLFPALRAANLPVAAALRGI
jgi:putative ABC transport system permease protein